MTDGGDTRELRAACIAFIAEQLQLQASSSTQAYALLDAGELSVKEPGSNYNFPVMLRTSIDPHFLALAESLFDAEIIGGSE